MRPSMVGAVVALAFVLCTVWFFTTHEKTTREEYAGYQGEARFNNFLAAELLCRELGHEADSHATLTPTDWLPPTSDTVVSRVSATFSVSPESEMLIDWVASGGHLVLLPSRNASALENEFLARLGMRFVLLETNNAADPGGDGSGQDDAESYAYLVDLDNTHHRVEAVGDEGFTATLEDDRGIIAARGEWGGGYFTAIADADYFTNDGIRESDHARLLLDAVAGYVEPGKIWFIYDAAFPSLWQVLWEHAHLAVIGLAAALLLWIWSIAPSFGPAIDPTPPVRRSIVEHIRATGNFGRRNRAAKTLAESATSALLHRAESRHPGIGRLSLTDQAKQLAKITGLPARKIFDALASHDGLRQRDFTRQMQMLQTIRKEL